MKESIDKVNLTENPFLKSLEDLKEISKKSNKEIEIEKLKKLIRTIYKILNI